MREKHDDCAGKPGDLQRRHTDSPSATIPSSVVIAIYRFENVTTEETGS